MSTWHGYAVQIFVQASFGKFLWNWIYILTSKSADFEWSMLPSITWMSLIQSVENLNRTKTDNSIPEQEGIMLADCFWTWSSTPPWLFTHPAGSVFLENLANTSLHFWLNQWLKPYSLLTFSVTSAH